MDRLLMKTTGIPEMSLCSCQATPHHVAEGRNLRGCLHVSSLVHSRFEITAMHEILLFVQFGRLLCKSSVLSYNQGAISLGVKRLQREADHSSPFGAVINTA
jgi:hypothetical protein